MNKMKTAPKDDTPVLLKFKDDLKQFNEDDEWWVKTFSGIFFVGRNRNDKSQHNFDMGWSFAAPVGYGGIPDIWLEGWEYLPDKRKSCLLYNDAKKNCEALKSRKKDLATGDCK